MSDNRFRGREILHEVAQEAGPKVKLVGLSFQDMFIVNDLVDSGYLTGNAFGTDQAIVRITLAGRNYLDQLSVLQRPWWKKAIDNIVGNIWSILLAVLASWALFFFGPQ